MNTKAPATAAEALAGTAPEPQERQVVRAALKVIVPVLLTVLTKILQTESLGAARAYALSDIPGILAGDRFTARQLNNRIRAAGMEQVCGSLAGKIRGEFSTPLFQEWNVEGAGREQQHEGSEEELAEMGL